MARVMQDNRVLEVNNLSFAYPKSRSLYEDISLHVNIGEVVCILGPSGSGKSTMLELIVGNLKAQKGTIQSKKCSQVFQDPYTSFHPTYTIRNQIEDVADTRDLAFLCESLELEEYLLDKKMHQLSGGQLQRCSILRALLMKPELLLADEPTSALDNINQLEVMKLLVRFLDRVGILLITHDEDLAKWIADRTIRL